MRVKTGGKDWKNQMKLRSRLSKGKLFVLSQTGPGVFCVIVLQVSVTIYFKSAAAGSWLLLISK